MLIVSCGQKSKLSTSQSIKKDTLFTLYDTLDIKYNSIPVNLDTLYSIANHVKILADNYISKDTLALADIYKHCAEILRSHCSDCNSNGPSIFCCKDSLRIIDCYVKALNIYLFNNDTLSYGYTDVLFQLADVYEQMKNPALALPLRKKYLNVAQKKDGAISDMAADGFMFIGGTYELLNNYQMANDNYQQELQIRENLNKGNLHMVRERILDFQKRHNLQKGN